MNELDRTYQLLARAWTHEELAARYPDARRRATSYADDGELDRPIAALAAAIPPASALGVAVHVLHALPDRAQDQSAQALIETAATNAVDALARCHRALELDAAERGYAADGWLPLVYDITGPLLESARLDLERPTLVRAAQEAVGWLARAVAELDRDAAESASALAETLARLLAVVAFANAARDQPHPATS